MSYNEKITKTVKKIRMIIPCNELHKSIKELLIANIVD